MIVSIHEYELATDATPAEFEAVVSEAESRDLFALSGLVDYEFLHCIKGARADQYTAIWRYESRAAWRELWGPVDDPVPKSAYPEEWQTWENELLSPVLAEDPDEITFTSYEVVHSTPETEE